MDRRFLRPGWMAGHLLVFAALLTCLRLGWWQWGRTQETTGTAQNFGYALLWPAFGAAFVYMWVRFLHLEVLKDVEDDEETERGLRELLDAGLPGDSSSSASPSSASPSSASPSSGSRSSGAPVGAPAGLAGPTEDPPDPGAVGADEDAAARRRQDRLASRLQKPSQGYPIAVATVGADDEDDPELTAYNQALAALAEEDRRRAR